MINVHKIENRQQFLALWMLQRTDKAINLDASSLQLIAQSGSNAWSILCNQAAQDDALFRNDMMRGNNGIGGASSLNGTGGLLGAKTI